ncbi:unnamed protein product [Prunus armeniaca]
MYGPLHALAVSLGQSSPAQSAVQQLGPVHTVAVQTHPSPSNSTAVSLQQYGQSNPTVSPLHTSSLPSGSHLQYGSVVLTTTHTNPGQTYGAYLVPPSSVATAEPPVQVAQQVRPQNEGQQVPRPVAAQQEVPPQDPLTEDAQRTTKDGSAQRRPGAPSYTKLYPPGKPRSWRDLISRASWARRTSKHSMSTFPYILTYGHDIHKLMELEVRCLQVFTRLRRKMKSYAQTMPRSLEKLEQ